MAGQAAQAGAGDLIERLKELREIIEKLDLLPYVRCNEKGCIELSRSCLKWGEYTCLKYDIEVKIYGRPSIVREAIEEIEKLAEAYKKFDERREAFKRGRATFLEIYESARRLEELVEKTKKRNNHYEALLRKILNPLSYNYNNYNSDRCRRLIDAINEIVEHPEAEA